MPTAPVNADQELFDRLLVKKQAEIRAQLSPRQVFGYPGPNDAELAKRREEREEEEERRRQERSRKMYSFLGGLFDEQLDKYIQRDIDAQAKALGECTRALKEPPSDKDVAEYIMAAARKAAGVVPMPALETFLFGGESMRVENVDPRNFDVGMKVKVTTDPDCPKDRLYLVKSVDDVGRIIDLAECGALSPEDTRRLLDMTPPGSLFGVDRTTDEYRLQGQRVKPATIGDLSAVLKDIWSQDALEDLYKPNPMFGTFKKEESIFEKDRGALVDLWMRETEGLIKKLQRHHAAGDFEYRGPPPEEQDLSFLRDDDNQEIRIAAGYVNLQCKAPGYNFKLTLDDEPALPTRTFTEWDLHKLECSGCYDCEEDEEPSYERSDADE